jgi:hypothetical protein
MRFSATITGSILFALLALDGAVGAPAPQYDTTEIVMTTVEATAAGSAMASSSIVESASSAPAASASASKNACKAKTAQPEWAQLWRQHRRPRPSASAAGDSASAAPTGQEQVSSSGSEVSSVSSSDSSLIPITSVVETEPTPVASEMPSVVETAPIVTATAIQAGGNGGAVQNPRPSQVVKPSVVTTSSSYAYSASSEWSSSTQWSTSSAQPAPSAPASAAGAPEGFAADILNAHNTFRATWGTSYLCSSRLLTDDRCRAARLEPEFG